MTTKRIRCGCGRVYDPVKRPACPDCGATNVVAPVAPPDPTPPETTGAISKTPTARTAPPSGPSPVFITPRLIVIGAAVLCVLVFLAALSRCGGKEKVAVIEHASPTVQPSATPSAAASATATATALAALAERSPVEVIPPPEENDLAAQIAKAAPGATIKVRPGTYPSLTLTRPIKLAGDPNAPVFIKGEGQSALTVKSPGVSLQNIQLLTNGIGVLPAVAVAEGAALEMNAVAIQSTTEIGVLVASKASLKALGATFAVPSGVGIRLQEQATAHLTQCAFSDSKTGLNALSGATAELHSCAFERVGGNDGHGSIIALNGEGTAATADDCRFKNNGAGCIVSQQASLTIKTSDFQENAASVADGILGLISVRNGGRAKLEHDRFESNRHGIAVLDGGSVEITQCNLAGNGLDQRQVVPASLPLLVSGEKSRATLRKTTISNSAQYAIGVMAGGDLTLEDVEISGSRIAGLILGERKMAPVHAFIRRSHLNRNGTGLGLLAGSNVEMEDCEILENNDGIIAFDPGTRLRATRIALVSNRDRGLYVYSGASANLLDCDLKNNGRGAISGTRGRASERATITLENCRLGGNTVFGAGAATESELTLTNCVFDGTDKTKIYQERGAKIQTNELSTPAPAPPDDAEPSPSPEERVSPSPSPESSAPPSPRGAKATPRPRRKPTPRPHPPTPEDIRRALRKLLPGGN